jgi:hypothetical protein
MATSIVPVREGPVPAWVDRVLAGIVVAAGVTVVAMLAAIDPDPRGLGTHEQLGMAPCGWPERFGMPCPTCGVTTAACHLVHLSPWRALVTQPFGAALAAVGLFVAATAAADLVRGHSFVARVFTVRLPRWIFGGLALLLLAWGYKAKFGM